MSDQFPGVPEGYHSVTPYLSIKNAATAIAFYEKAFGAKEIYRLEMGEKIGHAELQIGNSRIMLADEFPEMPDAVTRCPSTLNGSTVGMCIYLEHVDAAVEKATEAGAVIKKALVTQFYGDRTATLMDPFGHIWMLAQRIEDVSPEEMKIRMQKEYGG